jgi:hypothetical protein
MTTLKLEMHQDEKGFVTGVIQDTRGVTTETIIALRNLLECQNREAAIANPIKLQLEHTSDTQNILFSYHPTIAHTLITTTKG